MKVLKEICITGQLIENITNILLILYSSFGTSYVSSMRNYGVYTTVREGITPLVWPVVHLRVKRTRKKIRIARTSA